MKWYPRHWSGLRLGRILSHWRTAPKQRVPAKFIKYPDSYHGGWTPCRTVHSIHYQREWWRQYLKEKPKT